MKHFLPFLIVILVGYVNNLSAQTKDPSAVLEITSTTQGFLPPRMTLAQMNAIGSPAEGLLVYCTNCQPKGMYYNSGSAFLHFSSKAPSGSLANLNCGWSSHYGTLTNGTAASGVSTLLPYSGGPGTAYTGGSFSSNGVTGLTATIGSGTFTTDDGTITVNITGTPSAVGTATFNISLAGKSCSIVREVESVGEAVVESDDPLRNALSTSVSAYDTANVGTWVSITAAEYNNLAATISEASRAGHPNLTGTPAVWTSNYTIGKSNGFPDISSNLYIVAFAGNFDSASTGLLLKTSASLTSGYANYFSSFATTGAGLSYFVLKQPSSKSLGTHYAVYNANAGLGILGSSGSNSVYYAAGNANSLSLSGSGDPVFEVIVTPTKSW